MPMKLNVGVSRKVGLPDYGSVGASCNLELEVENGLIDRDLDGLHARIRGAYVAAHQAVHDELARLHVDHGGAGGCEPTRDAIALPARNGHARSNGDVPSRRTSAPRARATRSVTPNQLKAIGAIARRLDADLPELLRREYDVERPEDLTIRQASELIDRLKADTRE